MKKFILTFFVIIFGLNYSFASDECSLKKWFEAYSCKTSKYCVKYKPKFVVYKVKDFEKAENSSLSDAQIWAMSELKVAKELYRKNQNWIYSCAIIKTQKNSLLLVKNKLLKLEKTWTLSSNIMSKIELRLNKLDLTIKSLWCNITDKNSIYSKKDILDESTYEMCKYSFYLDYLADYYDNAWNVIWSWALNADASVEKKNYSVSYINNLISSVNNSLQEEKNHTYEIYKIAFQAYTEYESNYPVHLLLELIKDDFIVFREKLYQALNPINQVWYKIMNAMSTKD